MNLSELFTVNGKTALVTGGSDGIGFMIAAGLVQSGCRVIICSRKGDAVQKAVEELTALGDVTGVVADVSTEEGLGALASAVGEAGALNILVNNAGATWGGPLGSFSRKGFEKVLNVNLLAPFEVIRALLPALRRAASRGDPARVINIGSIDGIQLPEWESYPYSASKAGLHHMSRHLGKSLAEANISVNVVAPGFFPSRMTASVLDFSDPETSAAVASPLGERVGTPEDIVGSVLYLCSRAGAWLTGVTIPVAGGRGTIDN